MKAVKMKSGRWRVTVYDYTDADGKQHNRTFTGATKREAEQKAANREKTAERMPVKEAVQRYIDLKAPVLSPATVQSYDGIVRTHLSGAFGAKRADTLSQQEVQAWVSDLARKVSAKTVQNCYGLLTASLKFHYGAAPPSQTPPEEKAPFVCPHR